MEEKVKKNLSDGIIYDAFISYRHIEPDAFIAEKIHQKLERYHIPQKLRKSIGKKKHLHVFRDKEELSVSSNLTENIYNALDHSEFLVLICSPESMASAWVQREVEYFLQKHGKKQVITVLVKGEPEESFPEVLCRETKIIKDINGKQITVTVPVEPLAADVRGESKKESLKKLNTEILRILACMLQCSYDSLKQRHREYLIKRAGLIASLVVVALGSFGIYAYSQSKQIQTEHEAALQHQKESIQNQAKNLMQQSLDALGRGNREEALQKALAIDLEKRLEEPMEEAIVPEQINALNSVLYSYQDGQHDLFQIDHTLEIERLDNGCFSADGIWYYAWNESGDGYVFSGKNGNLIWKIDTSELEDQLTENDSRIVMLIPYKKNSVIVVMAHAIAVLDVSAHEFTKTFSAEADLTDISSYDFDKNLLILNAYEEMCLYDIEKGALLRIVDIYDMIGYQNNGEGEILYPKIKDVDIAKNGTMAVCAVSYFSFDLFNKPKEDLAGLVVYYIATGKIKRLSTIPATNVKYIDDTHIMAIHKEAPTAQKHGLEENYYKYYPVIYDSISGEVLYTGEKVQILDNSYIGIEIMNLKDGDKEYRAAVYWIDQNVSVVNLDTYEFYGTVVMDASVLNVSQFNEDSFLTGSSNGWVQKITFLSDMIVRSDCMNISAMISRIEYNTKESIIAVTNENGKTFWGKMEVDDGMTKVNNKEGLGSIENIEYYEVENQVYRCVNFRASDRFGYGGSVFYKVGSEDPVVQFYADKQGDYDAYDIAVFEKDGEAFAFIIESDSNGMATDLHMINLTRENEIGKIDISSYEINMFNDIAYNNTHDMLFSETSNGLEAFCISDTEVKKQNEFILEDNEWLEWWKITGDGKKIFMGICMRKNWNDETWKCLAFDTETIQIQQIEWDINMKNSKIISGNTSSKICIQEGKILYLLDSSDGRELSRIKLTTDESVDVSFFRNDELLLVTYMNIVELYDVQSGYLLGNCTFQSDDIFQKEFPNTLKLITDSSKDFFALKEKLYRASDKRNKNSYPLIVFSVDENLEIHKYAEIPYGYVSLAGKEIATKANDSYFFSTFYEFTYLKKKAEELLGENFWHQE